MRKPPATDTTRLKREMEWVILTPPLMIVVCVLAIGVAAALSSNQTHRARRT